MVFFSLFPTALGDCGIAWRDDGVVATNLPEKSRADTARRLVVKSNAVKGEPPPAIRSAVALMTSLLDGKKTDLSSIVCIFDGIDPFLQEVYAATRAIPAGETSTYGAIAKQLGDKQLARDVGQALGRNPMPIIVRCHRVLGADGRLTGFSAVGGVATKRRMLDIEGAPVSDAPGLFVDLPLAVKPRR